MGATLRLCTGLRHDARRSRSIVAQASEKGMTLIEDKDQYDALIADATKENRIVVIKFFASWCRACKAMAPKIDTISEEWADIEFYEIMFDNNKKLCKSLGIKVLPFIEIVAGTNGKVESFSCGPSKISQLQAKLEVHGGCEDIPCTDVSALVENL